MTGRLLLFLAINFSALALGGLFTGKGVPSDWYAGLNKAPWTPPGWVFGFAWSSIMICFSAYLSYLWPKVENKSLLMALFLVQLVLNVGWNPAFFHFHWVGFALFIILALTAVIGLFIVLYRHEMKYGTLLLVPYFLWLLIASSLNAYIWLKN